MDLLRKAGPCAGRSPALVVMLPGAYSRPQEFVDEGFVEALRQRGVAADVVIADAHMGYVADRSILRRVREDVVLPARAAGYGRIWLLGISLGGFAALGYAVRHGGEIEGVLALAPYLGPRRLLQEIGDAGGARNWQAGQPPFGSDDADREIWARIAVPDPAVPLPPIFMGSGDSDRFATAHREFAALLPRERVSGAPGGHDWATWRLLWQGWLARGLLPTHCGGGTMP